LCDFSAENRLPFRVNFNLYIKILSCRMDKLDVKPEITGNSRITRCVYKEDIILSEKRKVLD
jgi:hypothetical protein